MLLTSVIIVLREVLEAALVLSILLAMSRLLRLHTRWFYISLAAGAIGSAVYGVQVTVVSNAFGGMGQELLNAALHFAIGLLLAGILSLLVINYYAGPRRRTLLLSGMAAAMTLVVVREGAEIFIYLSAFRYSPEPWSGVLTGSLLGAGIGFSTGALFYYLLLSLPRRWALLTTCVLLTLVAGGMCLQAAQLLIQAGWLPAQVPLWDSSALLSEESIAGQVLYTLAGYEATPTAFEVMVYIAIIVAVALLLLFIRSRYRENGPRE